MQKNLETFLCGFMLENYYKEGSTSNVWKGENTKD